MKNKRIVGATLAVVVAGAIGVLAQALTTNDASSATTRTPDTSVPTTVAEIELTAGAVGPITVGQSKTEALATGLFDADLPATVEGCATVPLAWKAPFSETFDVQTRADGTITSIGVRAAGPTTAAGLGVDSTYAEVRAAVAGAPAVAAGYGQSGVLVHDAATDGWIGYLFDTPVADLAADDKVSFVEITRGSEPGLMRDGC